MNRTCIVSGDNNCGNVYIVPLYINQIITNPNIIKLQCNNILLNYTNQNKFNNFEFTIYPEPINFEYFNINNENVLYATFNIILPNGSYKECKLPYQSKYFITWHFMKFVEKHNINKGQFGIKKMMSSDDYMNNIIKQIHFMDNINMKDKDNDNIMYPEFEKN